jgi:hypothetical protein
VEVVEVVVLTVAAMVPMVSQRRVVQVVPSVEVVVPEQEEHRIMPVVLAQVVVVEAGVVMALAIQVL